VAPEGNIDWPPNQQILNSSGAAVQDEDGAARRAMAAMGQKETKGGAVCVELGITRQALYRHVSPAGELRPDGAKVLSKK